MRKFLLLIFMLFMMCLYACGSTSHKVSNLPTNAKNVRRVGNGWVTFELDERTFLYHRANTVYGKYEAITQIK